MTNPSGHYPLANSLEPLAALAKNKQGTGILEKGKQLKARAPAKLILTGEHAVVYGMPAIAMAVNRYAESTILTHTSPNIFFNFLNLKYAKSITLSTLMGYKKRIQEQYHAFLEGQCSIREVLKMPFELLQFTVTHLFETLNIPLAQGLEIRSSSNIPMGCGMGSSAAAIMSTLFALSHFYKLDIDPIRYISLGREAENLQHGRSSGLDLQLVMRGGCLKFQEGHIETREVPTFPIVLVHSGKPETTTGQCVSAAAEHFKKPGTANSFEEVTLFLDKALARNDTEAVIEGIRENHRLLMQIGVVPEKVQHFIAAIEKEGGAAKICGAGAVAGESGGILWIIAKNNISKLIRDYGYVMYNVEGDKFGTKII
jgi:mevalonate kinase